MAKIVNTDAYTPLDKNATEGPDTEEFWEERGILPAVRDARPYTRYSRHDVRAVQDAFKGLPAATRAVVTRKAKLADGLIIHRHKATEDAPAIYPELRPDTAISTERPTYHWHGFGDPPDTGKFYMKLNPYTKSGLDHRWKWHTHPKGKVTKENREARERGEQPGNTEEPHFDPDPGKYQFASAPRRPETEWHTHDEKYRQKKFANTAVLVATLEVLLSELPPRLWDRALWAWLVQTQHEAFRPQIGKYSNELPPEEKRLLHVKVHHGGVDTQELHPHIWRVPDDDYKLAARIDIHPMADKLLDKAELVYFGIEGCIKADAILSAIIKDDRPDSVFSVPAVSLWGTPKLGSFAKRLEGKVVVIVPDGDWVHNPRVMEQARLCRTSLRRLYGIDAYVAAPPADRLEEGIKGIDDFLGLGGGSLDDLIVQERVVDEGKLLAWVNRTHPGHPPLDKLQRKRALIALHGLAEHHSDEGCYHGTLAAVARVLGVNEDRVERGIKDLEKLGAIWVDGDLADRQKFYTRRYMYAGKGPVIHLAKALRGKDLPPYPLKELIARMREQNEKASDRARLREEIRVATTPAPKPKKPREAPAKKEETPAEVADRRRRLARI